TPGAITHVEVPLTLVADADSEQRVRGALALETDPAGTQLATQLGSRDGTGELWLRYGRPFEDSTVDPSLIPELVGGDVMLPLGGPWGGSPELYLGGRRRWDPQDWLQLELMTGGREAPWRGLHVMARRPTGAAGVMWVRREDLSELADAMGAYWQRDLGSIRVALQGLWGTGGPASAGAMAWGGAAVLPLGDRLRLEGTYRSVPPEPPAPWLQDRLRSGWSVGLRWQPWAQSEWHAVFGLHETEGTTLELAGRVGNWQVRQRLFQTGAWRPATRLSVTLPGSGLWLGVEADAESPAQWQLGGGTEAWTWSVEAGGASGGRGRLGWQGRGPLQTTWRVEATWHFGGGATAVGADGGAEGAGALAKPGTLLERLDWRLQWDKLSAPGHGWHGEVVWQPSDPQLSAAVSLGWRRLHPAYGRWIAWEVRWERAVGGETWQAGVSGRRPAGVGGELTSQLVWRRAWREGAGALHTGQLTLIRQQPLSEGWQSLVGVRWWVQWSETGLPAATGTVLDLGLTRELGSGWRFVAGWRLPWGDGADDSGPYARLEWQPALVSGSAEQAKEDVYTAGDSREASAAGATSGGKR
ncbi:MAG TPA: hypothetical protein VIK93_02910, partial [Limnochordales bacterium]